MIFYDGEYSGILKPDVHYVLLEKDHSNFEKVIEACRASRIYDFIKSTEKERICINDIRYKCRKHRCNPPIRIFISEILKSIYINKNT